MKDARISILNVFIAHKHVHYKDHLTTCKDCILLIISHKHYALSGPRLALE